MPYKKLSPDLTPDDEKLAKVLSQTLDKSLDDIDAVSLQRLKHARVHALHQPIKRSRQWLPLSVAASIAALLLIPILVQPLFDSKQALDLASQDIFSQEVPLSSQELDDLEMLMALEDSDV
ncbi:MAG TPA: hypothetical protein PK002_11530 [Cellvibrio sp.]|nr:hypothetical protein [Cellvibrio sp.]